jgi:hypothetical protein
MPVLGLVRRECSTKGGTSIRLQAASCKTARHDWEARLQGKTAQPQLQVITSLRDMVKDESN